LNIGIWETETKMENLENNQVVENPTKTQKVAKVKKVTKKSKVTKGSQVTKSKRVGLGKQVYNLFDKKGGIKNLDNISYEEVEKFAKKLMPNTKFNKMHMSWYKNKYREMHAAK
jgi:hypothetical protein